MNRRTFAKTGALAAAGVYLGTHVWGKTAGGSFPVVRTPAHMRNFTSPAIEKAIGEVQKNIGNRELAWMFGNCFPNTLDTTVDFNMHNGRPDTYVITGDIDAMWLRDSTAQVWPYLAFCREDAQLKLLIEGVINRQTTCIHTDPYANAFYKDGNRISEWHADLTDMKPGLHERKWEVDSLCYPIRLAYGYWKTTGDTRPFNKKWVAAMELVIKTFCTQQRKTDKGPYSFMRSSPYATDSVPLNGYGYPVSGNGLICSIFRPSDDATIYPYLIPSNFFAIISLQQLAELAKALHQTTMAADATQLANEVLKAFNECATVKTEQWGEIFAYEVNGYGSYNLMDDANIPSLLSMPYIDPVSIGNRIYANTRKFLLSESNPFYFKGKAGEGIGGPHAGMNRIWPLSIIMRALTSTNNHEIAACLSTLQASHAGTGFMHESFDKDDASVYSRKWFAWANTIFGELIWKTYRERKQLLG